MLSRGITEKEILEEYPLLEQDDIRACLVYTAQSIDSTKELI